MEIYLEEYARQIWETTMTSRRDLSWKSVQ